MLFLIILILIYSIIFLTVFVLAHQDANMIKPLTGMTIGMLILLAFTGVIALIYDMWYISLAVVLVIIGLINFLVYLFKY